MKVFKLEGLSFYFIKPALQLGFQSQIRRSRFFLTVKLAPNHFYGETLSLSLELSMRKGKRKLVPEIISIDGDTSASGK